MSENFITNEFTKITTNHAAYGTLPKDEIIDIITTIAVYKFSSLSREEVEVMLGLSLEETRVYREAKAEGEEKILKAAVPLLLKTGRRICTL